MPPAGLLPEQVPQFIVFGSDDNGNSGLEGSGATGGLHFLTELFSGRRNPAGSGNPLTFDASPLHYSFYVNTYYIMPRRRQGPLTTARTGRIRSMSGAPGKKPWTTAMRSACTPTPIPTAGNSVPGSGGRRCSAASTSSAALAADDAATTGLGVDRGRLAGFRTPFLEYNDDTLKAVRQLGFLYDCSLEEGTQPDQDGGNFLWPYRLDHGSPGNTPLIGPHPGLWEIPVYVFIVPPDERVRTLWRRPPACAPRCSSGRITSTPPPARSPAWTGTCGSSSP